jgi:hypothetical protein
VPTGSSIVFLTIRMKKHFQTKRESGSKSRRHWPAQQTKTCLQAILI